MTIPIQPGPFSFLAPLGQALGNYADAKEKNRERTLAEAKDQAHNYIALRLAGLMKPKDFDTPEVQAVFHAAGFGPVSAQETPDELLRGMKGDYLSGLINPSMAKPMTDETRSLVGAPERGLTQGIDAKIAQNTATARTAGPKADAEIAQAGAAVPTAQLQGAQATAALPEAGNTVVAGQQGDQDKTYSDIADRVVEDYYNTTKKIPDGAAAYARGQADPRAQAFKGAITAPYYGAAAERLRAKLAVAETARLAAQARERGAAGNGMDDFAKIYQNQQTRLTAELNALQKPDPLDVQKADIAAAQRARGKQPGILFTNAEKRVGEYNRRKQEIEQQLQQVGDQLTTVVGGKIGVPGNTPPGQSGSPPKRAAAAEYERQTKGITDPAKRKAIGAAIAKKYNIPQGGAQ